MPRSDLTREIIVELLKQPGIKQADIARMYNVSPAAVSQKLKKPGPPAPTKGAYKLTETVPWSVDRQYRVSPFYRKLLNHLEYMENGEKDLTRDKRKRLSLFYRELEEYSVVVEFDPSIPPGPGNAGGGWRYVPRTEADGDLIIRVNEHTEMTPRDYTLWKMPKIRPVYEG
ncbi:winged helix-turn-helix transcriptional regulator [Amycolatopsis halotolerans]|uniref:Winged helix-turn-helix transcriptional regulator n=1 Tax=Amycolatopsis halotolerans TaxID=330083 RepID=A0ABV7QYB6_9PSEU